jgi:hypothetical protein
MKSIEYRAESRSGWILAYLNYIKKYGNVRIVYRKSASIYVKNPRNQVYRKYGNFQPERKSAS